VKAVTSYQHRGRVPLRSHRFKWILHSLFEPCALLGFVRAVPAQSRGLALTHVTIIDPGVGKPQHDMTLLVRGHDIVAVGRAKQVMIPTSDKVIDGTGKFVIPGLWDMHSHFRDPRPTGIKWQAGRSAFCFFEFFSQHLPDAAAEAGWQLESLLIG